MRQASGYLALFGVLLTALAVAPVVSYLLGQPNWGGPWASAGTGIAGWVWTGAFGLVILGVGWLGFILTDGWRRFRSFLSTDPYPPV